MNQVKRRKFLKLATLPALAPIAFGQKLINNTTPIGCSNLKLSLNAFSFNGPLSKGEMTVEQMIDFCAEAGFAAVDITAYYFPHYPLVPGDDYLYHIKQYAFLKGIDISGTGVRNDFTDPDAAKRKGHVQLVKNWVLAAAKLGAPVVRVFSGNMEPDGYSRDQVAEWMVKDLKECVEFGKKNGVVVAVQNHYDFIRTPEQAEKLIKMVDSEWFGLILDTGGYRFGDPYAEIAKSIPYTVNWQIKEKIFVNNEEVDVDMPRLIKVIKNGCYNGYVPIETLGAGDPKKKVLALLDLLKKAIADT
ncbi:MAG: sugar phosphate isomerase/epimerase [Bacteroidetes bacterium]|nr:sugar phosphate isomerase/epimerase [Bacteroidota bacterium]MDA1119970.1 sugar phosphate isomerase/epimerase [Bacteroidota bacterium]